MRCPYTSEQTEHALAFGATGIGLTRTEHMFFEGNRIDAMREMILADNVDDRKKALAKLLPYQKGDFVGIFKALKGFSANISFLDPPLHEFLPHEDAAQQNLAKKMGVPVAKLNAKTPRHRSAKGRGQRRSRPELWHEQQHAMTLAASLLRLGVLAPWR